MACVCVYIYTCIYIYVCGGVSIYVYASMCVFTCSYAHCLCKINFKQGGSSLDSPDWIKNKKQQYISSIRKINTFNMLQLSHWFIKNPEIITKIKPFIDK